MHHLQVQLEEFQEMSREHFNARVKLLREQAQRHEGPLRPEQFAERVAEQRHMFIAGALVALMGCLMGLILASLGGR